MDYKITDRLREVSSWMGLLLIGAAVWLGTKLTPDDPTRPVSLVLSALGAFGVAVPEKSRIVEVEVLAEAIVTALAKTQAAAKAGAPAMLGLLLLGGSLAACSDPQTTQKVLAVAEIACKVDGAVVPIADAALAQAGGKAAVIAQIDAGYIHPAVMGACAALNGAPVVVEAPPADASPPPAASAPAPAPATPTAP